MLIFLNTHISFIHLYSPFLLTKARANNIQQQKDYLYYLLHISYLYVHI